VKDTVNGFKRALGSGRTQIGLWLSLTSSYSAEICAGAGFDWLLIDCEHSPQSAPLVLAQMQAIEAQGGSEVIVRVASKQTTDLGVLLDMGARSILVPLVNNAAEAEVVARACRYPPEGHRGVGGGRASGWGRDPHYVQRANDECCVVVQVETKEALGNIEEIAAVEGVDALFVGPSDLAASLGHLGDPGHPDVQSAIRGALRTIAASGKAAGVLTVSEPLAHEYIALGVDFVAVGIDTRLLASETSALAARFRP
jgi:4-hydroxy-2-oxoheptanedioate aldolase